MDIKLKDLQRYIKKLKKKKKKERKARREQEKWRIKHGYIVRGRLATNRRT